MARYRIVPLFGGMFLIEEWINDRWERVKRPCSSIPYINDEGHAVTTNLIAMHHTEKEAEDHIRILMRSDTYDRDRELARAKFFAANPPREVPPFKW